MEEYHKKVISKLLEDIKGMDSTPDIEVLFKVQDNDTRKMLHGTKKIAFHHSVVQIISNTEICRKETKMEI